ncbi:MAG: hypothetical protein JW820_11565 [Spirochaetales bacterium]|nr:hypothetical protein [Spirochaetales bacterium]
MAKGKAPGAGRSSGGAERTAGKSRKGKGASGSPKTPSAQKQRLEGELIEAIQQVDEEGLLFLLQQAQILVHNAQVDRLNQEMLELQERRGRAGGAAAPAEAPAGQGARSGPVRIDEADNRKSFFLDFGGVRKALSLQEMQRIVKICYAAESKSAALRQLYTVFSRERGDILADARIGGPSSPLLDALFHAVRQKYRLEER